MTGRIAQLAEQIAEAIEAGRTLEEIGESFLEQIGDSEHYRWIKLGESPRGPILVVVPGYGPHAHLRDHLFIAEQIHL